MTFRLTRDHREEWAQCFNRMAVGKSTPIDDKKIKAHWELLESLPLDAVIQAAEELKREPGPFLTDPGTWFRRADNIAAQMLEDAATTTVQQLTGAIEHEGQSYVCVSCKDRGWRMQDHPHQQPTAWRCSCVNRNPVLIAERARLDARQASRKRA